MIRRTKKRLSIDEESLQRILDECYHETNDLKIEITNLYTIWNSKVNEIGEIAVVGKDIVNLLNQRDKIIDKKLKVAQQIHNAISEKNKLTIVEMSNKNSGNTEHVPGVLSSDIGTKIEEMIEAAKKNKNI